MIAQSIFLISFCVVLFLVYLETRKLIRVVEICNFIGFNKKLKHFELMIWVFLMAISVDMLITLFKN